MNQDREKDRHTHALISLHHHVLTVFICPLVFYSLVHAISTGSVFSLCPALEEQKCKQNKTDVATALGGT